MQVKYDLFGLKLSPAAGQVITLQYFGGLSQKEIASVLGISSGNVRVIALRARTQLKVFPERTMLPTACEA